MNTQTAQDMKMPWYRQFWFWFVFAIPACGVVAGVATVVIASQNPPQLTQSNIGKFAQVQAQPAPSAGVREPEDLANEQEP